ncbi:hypothetical protein FQN55_003361 [Onygenales sp. PD_40]|nr:hypothetical protein FQN55_003361 [Onygenales sp. PD_40]
MAPKNQVLAALAAVAIAPVNAAMGLCSALVLSPQTLSSEKQPLLFGSSGILSLWVGMGTSNGDLIQSIADNVEGGDWSVFAYTLMNNSQEVIQGPSAPAAPGDQVAMHYKYEDATGNYTQSVLVNGNEVSTLSTSDGYAQGWGSAIECAATDCGTIGAHSWLDTEIILDVAGPNYIGTLFKGEDVTGDLLTNDGGNTWTASAIGVPEFTF